MSGLYCYGLSALTWDRFGKLEHSIEDHSHRFCSFEDVTPAEIKNIIKSSCNKTSPLDPFPYQLIGSIIQLKRLYFISLIMYLIHATIKKPQFLLDWTLEFGVKGSVLSWLSLYLTGRSQFVKISTHSSPIVYLFHAVPQGSVLGPHLFRAKKEERNFCGNNTKAIECEKFAKEYFQRAEKSETVQNKTEIDPNSVSVLSLPFITHVTSDIHTYPTAALLNKNAEEDNVFTERVNKSTKSQYVVNVLVSQNTSFNVQIGDQMQVISGPATVRMVSNTPPEPIQTPNEQDQVVQQIVDDTVNYMLMILIFLLLFLHRISIVFFMISMSFFNYRLV
ncbi:hypothetical protein HELRODRAFT_177448 [Helobdella robusta]|uniref:Uncharacterized protein n=1 Tax=Helobdella robusta TaxID=6412 RepID=T1FBQ3_HELRO|nr:hypothetical protein HELRODRAFT_177448 [Helobdella robusta]ESN97824.1 hypothetical protein HELRODRAFT_177448 [Helobdella robusta]